MCVWRVCWCLSQGETETACCVCARERERKRVRLIAAPSTVLKASLCVHLALCVATSSLGDSASPVWYPKGPRAALLNFVDSGSQQEAVRGYRQVLFQASKPASRHAAGKRAVSQQAVERGDFCPPRLTHSDAISPPRKHSRLIFTLPEPAFSPL